MEIDRFDRLTMTLSTIGTRRGLLQLLPLTGGLGAFGLITAAAKTGKPKKKCKTPCGSCQTCKKGKCKPKADGTICGPDQICSGGGCILPACGAGGPCRVFVSSTLYDGNLGGLDGADAKCQGLANAAGLPGIYKAWLSDSTNSPVSRFVPSSGPYRLVNGTTIAANFTDLTDGTLLAPITVTETGGGVGTTDIWTWTNTRSNGSRESTLNEHCANWSMNTAGTGTAGRVTNSDDLWTYYGPAVCWDDFRLYCFQQS